MNFIQIATLTAQTLLITPRNAGQVLRFAGVDTPTTALVPVRVMGTGLVEVSSGWWDQLLIVAGSYAGPYFDGSTPDPDTLTDYAWTGTVNASPSTLSTRAEVLGPWIPDPPRTFNLGLRARTIDHNAQTVQLELASDEALLTDYGVLVEDLGAVAVQSSLRGIVNYVLGKIGATLAAGGPDADFTTYSNGTNLIPDPRATGVGGVWPTSGGTMVYDTGFPGSGSPVLANGAKVTATDADSYLSVVADAIGGIQVGMRAGTTYVMTATGSMRTIGTGAVAPGNRSRRLVAFVKAPSLGGAFVEYQSAQIPNVAETGPLTPGNEHRVSVTFTLPEDTTDAFIRCYLGHAAGVITWAKWQLTEKSDSPAIDDTVFFTGTHADTAGYRYDWTGTPDNSPSTRTALVDRSPDLLVWRPGVTGWEFLSPIMTTANTRLFCDELRVWRLVTPDYAVPGQVVTTDGTATQGTDTISRDNEEGFATGVVVRYAWTDAAGEARTAVEAVGTPQRITVIDYARPYPGPGAAAAVLARRDGSGRSQEVTALAKWPTTPGMTAQTNLPAAPGQLGKLSAVRFSLGDDALMSLTTRTLIDIQPGAIDLLAGTIDALTGTIDAQ